MLRYFMCAILLSVTTVHADTDKPELWNQAIALQQKYPLIDGHNDFPFAARMQGLVSEDRAFLPDELPKLHTDIKRLREARLGGQFWVVFVPADEAHPAHMALEQLDLIHRMIDNSEWLELATTPDQIRAIHRRGHIASLIGMEGGHILEQSLALLRQYHALGVRYLTLTHNSTTNWADSATDNPRHDGLNDFGADVIKEMNRLGMLVDLSHTSDKTMKDALRISIAPVIFSHSSARAIADHPCNVPDNLLRRLAENGGVIMVNYYSVLLVPEASAMQNQITHKKNELLETQDIDRPAGWDAYKAWMFNHVPRGSIDDILIHIDHIVSVAGIDHVGLGSDFDGVTLLPSGLDDVSHYPALIAALLGHGYKEDEVAKIMGGNILRVMGETEQIAAQMQGDIAEDPADTHNSEQLAPGAPPVRDSSATSENQQTRPWIKPLQQAR